MMPNGSAAGIARAYSTNAWGRNACCGRAGGDAACGTACSNSSSNSGSRGRIQHILDVCLAAAGVHCGSRSAAAAAGASADFSLCLQERSAPLTAAAQASVERRIKFSKAVDIDIATEATIANATPAAEPVLSSFEASVKPI
jgi:hypothetical protein